MRKDGSHLDFEQVTMGSLVFVEKNCFHDPWTNSEMIDLRAGDIWLVATLVDRPRIAVLRNLQRGATAKIRVDDLLELDDKDVVTIGPA